MSEPVFGVIAPHPPIMIAAVGGSRANVTHDSLDALSAVREAVALYAPDLLVVMSPHAPALADVFTVDDSAEFIGSLSQFGDFETHRWPGDPEFARALAAEAVSRDVPTIERTADSRLHAGTLDHGALVPLSLIDPMHSVPLVVLSLSYEPYEEHRVLGEAVAAVAQRLGRKTVFLASGDMSHRLTPDAPAGYSERAVDLDSAIRTRVEQGELAQLGAIAPDLVEAGGECGLRSFVTLGGFAGEDPVPTRVLAYEGPWGVGYMTALVGQAALDSYAASHLTASSGSKGGTGGEDASEIVRLARSTIESFVREGVQTQAPHLTDTEYPDRAGAFVSLHRGGHLRGCIGTVLPTRNSLAEEVAANAIEAATRDPRFPPVAPDELADLEVKVDVLFPPETCSIADLDPEQYGVVVSSGWRRGLLLPDLEGVDDVRQQIEIAMQKAGIRPGEPCGYERFRVDRYT